MQALCRKRLANLRLSNRPVIAASFLEWEYSAAQFRGDICLRLRQQNCGKSLPLHRRWISPYYAASRHRGDRTRRFGRRAGMARLSMNELTTYRWSFEEDLRHYAAAGYEGIGVWREKI